MTEPPLIVFSVPDRFEIDGPLVARAIEERDIPVVAPAFRDPGIGGENGMPPFDEDELRRDGEAGGDRRLLQRSTFPTGL